MLKKVLISVAMVPVVYLLIAGGLILSQSPSKKPVAPGAGGGIDFGDVRALPGEAPLPDLSRYQARDGARLGYRLYPSAEKTNLVLILIHGSGWHSQQFQGLANGIAASGAAHVATPDLRGHGAAPEKRGDVDYIGQFEDDIADLMVVLKIRYPDAQFVVGGHSSGGGLVVRFAGGEYGDGAKAFILLAPYLQYDAPTTRANSGGWAKPLTRRIIGLTMLNNVGITWFNGLTAIQFSMPKEVLDGPLGDTATTAYSYRLNTAYAPRRKYKEDIAAMTQPFLLVAGTEDEAFYPEAYVPLMTELTSTGSYEQIEGANHLGVVNALETQSVIIDWLEGLN